MLVFEQAGIPEYLWPRLLVADTGHETPCWLLQGANSGTGRGGGYAKLSVCGYSVYAHIHLWGKQGGRLLRPGEQLDHECNNRRCVRKSHLKPRYQSMNIRLANKRRRASAACAENN